MNSHLPESRYRQLFETAREGIIILDDSGTIIDANPYLTKLLGYEENDLLEKKLWDIGPFKNIADTKTSFSDLKDKGSIRYENLPLQTKGGENIEVEFISNVYKIDETIIIQCNIRDINESKKTETKNLETTKNLEKLNRNEERTRKALLNVMEDLEEAKAIIEREKAKDEAVLAAIADAVLSCDKNGTILLFNKAAEELTEFTSKEAVGHHYGDIIKVIKEREEKPIYDFISKTMSSNTITKVPSYALLIRKNGHKVPVSGSAAPIVNTNKNLTGCVVVFQDVTHEREVDQIKSEFVSLASHQLRTPLTTINWLSESLLEGASGKLSPDQQKEIRDTYEASKRMVSLIDALLNVSRLEMGTVPVEPETVNIAQAAKISIKDLEPKISQKHISLHETYDQNLTSFQTDPNLFNIILQNLLSNAIKYSNDSGTISLKIHQEGNNLQITVEDEGIGIPRNQQKMIFTKLFRADNAQVADADGTGLGLYIVKAITASLGGEISFASTEGKGTIFKVILPLSGLIKKTGSRRLIVEKIK